jgi:hypothetical protein
MFLLFHTWHQHHSIYSLHAALTSREFGEVVGSAVCSHTRRSVPKEGISFSRPSKAKSSLKEVVQVAMDAMKANAHLLPTVTRAVLAVLMAEAEKYWPGRGQEAVAAVVVSHAVAAAVANASDELDANRADAVCLLADLLDHAARGIEFSQADGPWMFSCPIIYYSPDTYLE